MNQVIIKGNLTRDNELKYLPSGSGVCSNAVAVTKKWKDQSGQQKEKTLFIDIVVFGKGAEIFNQYTKKGSKILIRGSLELDQWQENQGQKRQKHKINVEEFEFLDSKSDNQQQNNNQYQPQQQYNQSPQQQMRQQEFPNDGGVGNNDLDDIIPF